MDYIDWSAALGRDKKPQDNANHKSDDEAAGLRYDTFFQSTEDPDVHPVPENQLDFWPGKPAGFTAGA